MELELKKKTLKVTIYGRVFENIRVPSVPEADQVDEDIKDKQGRDVFEIMVRYLENLGFPRDVIRELDQDDFLSLIRFVGNPKKK